MHGFNHVMVFNDNSTDNGLEELQPWIDTGFVSVYGNWTDESLQISWAFSKNPFKKAMTTKALLESNCKGKALEWDYDYYVSLDIDEYLMPREPYVTIVDELDKWMNYTERGMYCIAKWNYQSSPHILEPVNLLTIEAYHRRLPLSQKMNYYTSVSPKCAYRLKSPLYTNITGKFVAECFHFHGCNGWDHRGNTSFCTDAWKAKERTLLKNT